MASSGEEKAVVALEELYSGPMQGRELAQAREFFAYLRSNGQVAALQEVPSVDNGSSVLDIVGLFDTITKRGGVRRVQEQSLWKEVMAELGHPFDRQTLFAISVHYKNFLYGYEQATCGTQTDVRSPQQQKQQQQQQQQKQTPSQQQPPAPTKPQQQPPQPPTPPQSQEQQPQHQQQQQDSEQPGALDQAGASAQRYEQYQRLLRQRELEQQQQLRQQRHMEQLQQQEERQQQQQQRKIQDTHQHRKMQEQQQQQQQQQRFLLKQQQQQQQQLYQQQQQQQQRQQKAQQDMLMKQQQKQQQQQQQQQSTLYQGQHAHHNAYPKPGNGYPRSGNAFQSVYDHSRARSTGQHSGGRVSASIARGDLPRALRSNLPSEVCAAVNTLTLETYNAAEEVILDDVPGLLGAIFDLMDKLNPAVTQVRSLTATLCSRVPKGESSTPALLDASFAAAEEPGGLYAVAAAGLPPSGKGEMLLLLLNALRNASFVPSNERTIGHSARAIQHFVSLCSATEPDPAVFAATLDLFGRVTKHLDIWGRRLAETDYNGCKWAEDSLGYLAPAHVRVFSSARSRGGVLPPSSLEYVASLALVIPTLVAVVDDEERSRVLSALGIVSKLAQTVENAEAFNRVPDSFLGRLVGLLSIPLQGCDVLAPKDGVCSPEWLEYNCRVIPPSIAGVDAEVRESSLDVMSLLAGLSDVLRAKLGASPGCIVALTRIVITSTPGVRVDPQTQQIRRMAARTLTALAATESNHARIRPLYSEVLVAAGRDTHAADLLFNGLKAVFPAA